MSKNMISLRICSIKYVQDSCIENYKIFLKETKDVNKWEIYHGKLSIVKM